MVTAGYCAILMFRELCFHWGGEGGGEGREKDEKHGKIFFIDKESEKGGPLS